MTRIVVFDIDKLSIRTAGCYGNVESPTPMLNEFAAQATLFEQHYRSYTGTAEDIAAAVGSFPQSIPITCLSNIALPGLDEPSAVSQFQTVEQLTEVLETALEPESSGAWVRLASNGESVDSAIQLGLISSLVEQRVLVAVTSSSPTTDPDIRDEASVRVPLMIWTGDPARVQTVTSAARLADSLGLTEIADDDTPELAIIQSSEHVAIREPGSLLIASRELLAHIANISEDRLTDELDLTSDQLRLFRKPDDVWNVHNILVEEPAKGVAALVRLRGRIV